MYRVLGERIKCVGGLAMDYKKVKGFKALTEDQQEIFTRTHEKHMDACGESSKKSYQPKGVSWDKSRGCIVVICSGEGVWFHYTRDGSWY